MFQMGRDLQNKEVINLKPAGSVSLCEHNRLTRKSDFLIHIEIYASIYRHIDLLFILFVGVAIVDLALRERVHS